MRKHHVSLQISLFTVWLLQGEIPPLPEAFQQCFAIDFQPFLVCDIASLAPVLHMVLHVCEFREEHFLDALCVWHHGCGDFDEVWKAFSMLLEPSEFRIAVADFEHAGVSWGTKYVDPSMFAFFLPKYAVQRVGHFLSHLVIGEGGLLSIEDWAESVDESVQCSVWSLEVTFVLRGAFLRRLFVLWRAFFRRFFVLGKASLLGCAFVL